MSRLLSDATLDDLWRLLTRLEGAAAAAAGSADDPAQERVDRVYAAAVSASLVGAPASAGGLVTRLVVDRLTSNAEDVARAAAAAAAVLALCDIAKVGDRQRRFALVVRCLHGSEVPAGWQPPVDNSTGYDDGGSWQRLRRKGGQLGSVAGLSPDEGRLWQSALARLPIVGMAGAALAARDGVLAVVRRACEALELPPPSDGALRTVARTAASQLRDSAAERLAWRGRGG